MALPTGSAPDGRRGEALDLTLRLLTRSGAERVVNARRDPDQGDLPWADGYPLEGDTRAAASYASQVPYRLGPEGSNRYGYYQIVEDGLVVGGIGFHGPPQGGVVEVGYGVVPAVRRRGVASAALRQLLVQAVADPDVRAVVGRTTDENVASQKVMLGLGMRYTGRDTEFLHFEIDLRS